MRIPKARASRLATGLAALVVGADTLVGQQPGLPPAEATVGLPTLRDLATSWFDRMRRYDAASTSTERADLATASKDAKDAFLAAMARFDERAAQPLLRDAEALRAVFQDVCRPPAPAPAVGAITFRDEEGGAAAEFVPPGYDASRRHAAVLLLPDATSRTSRDALQILLNATWHNAASREQAIVVAPGLPADLDLDAPDGPRAFASEQRRIKAVLQPLGTAMRALHIDRDRVVVDCSKGAAGFGLRLAAWFPDRFAGLVLRWPVLDDAVRLDAVAGIPVLLVRCPDTAAACTQLAARLNGLVPGSCQTLEPRTEYPFAAERGIVDWVRHCRRDAQASRVVVAPLDDRYRRNRWVHVSAADPVDPDRPESGPRLVAEADRKANRITVTTCGVQSFQLLLGPALVDVREFTLVVDGKVETVRLQPSLDCLVAQVMQRSDPGCLWTATHSVKVQ